MAQSAGIPRIVRMNMHQFGGKVLHPHVQQAHISVGGAPRAAGGTGGVGAGFRAGSGTPIDRNDAAVTGEFEKNPTLRFLGMPIAGGSLTEKGQADKADYGALRAGSTAYATALSQGATQQEAARAAVSAGGVPFLAAMINHPSSPLANVQAFHSFLSGQGFDGQDERYSQVKGADGQIYNVPVDASGKAGQAEPVPGLPAAQPKLGPTVRTDQGFGRIGPDGNIVPVLDANGQRAQAPLSAAQQKAATAGQEYQPSDVPGLPDQITARSPKTNFTDKEVNQLAGGTALMRALSNLQQNASVAGLGKGPISTLAGQYFGTYGSGAQYKADLNTIRANAPFFMGSGYKAATENFMAGINSSNDAPSFIRLQTSKMLDDVRQHLQTTADTMTAGHHGMLPASTANQLIGVGVVPNGYQNAKTLDSMDPTQRALWKARTFPQSVSDQDKAALYTSYASRGVADPTSRTLVEGMIQKDVKQRAAMQQQQTASTAARAAQPAAQLAPGGGGNQPGGQSGQGAADQQPAQPQAQPAQGNQTQQVQPQDAASPAGEGEGNEVGGSALTAGQGGAPQAGGGGANGVVPGALQPLMPPAEQQGQPAPGVPGTNGQTPLPPPNPLPQVSQTVQPGGEAPAPASQPALNPAGPSPLLAPPASTGTAAQSADQPTGAAALGEALGGGM